MAVLDEQLTRGRQAPGGLFPYNDPRSKPGLYQTAGFGSSPAAAPTAAASLAAPRPPAAPIAKAAPKAPLMTTPGGLFPYNDPRGQKSLYGASALAGPAPAAPMQDEAAAPSEPSPSGGAVFGMYPSMAGSLRTTYGMDNRLRSGVQVGAGGTMQPVAPPILGGGDGKRMNAATDPRSFVAGDQSEASTELAKANVQDQPPSTPAGQYIGDEAVVDAKAPNDPKAVAVAQASSAAPGVYQAGNSFGDSPEAAAAMLARPAGMSAQNQAAFDAIGDRANAESMARVQAAANKATYDQQVAEAKAINERETRLHGSKEAVAALNAMQANEQNQAKLGMEGQRVAQEGQRVAIQGAQAQLAAGREARDAARGAIDLRAAQRMDALQSTILDPKSTPEAKQSASAALLLAQGKSPDDYQIVHAAGGQTTDPNTGLPIKQPDRLVRFSKRTGQFEEIAAAPTGQMPAVPADKAALVKGTTYQTARGPATWDGKQFMPVTGK